MNYPTNPALPPAHTINDDYIQLLQKLFELDNTTSLEHEFVSYFLNPKVYVN